MSELIETRTDRTVLRTYLLTTVCGLGFLASVGMPSQARAEDRPTVWIELGGQLERMGEDEQIFAPSFLSHWDRPEFKSVLPQQRPPRYSNGAEGELRLTPNGSDWVFSAAIRYGRANSKRELNQQLPKFTPRKGQQGPTHQTYYITQKIPTHLNSLTTHADRHLIVDFQVGKDVGLGMFTSKDSSTISLGVRFAQFTTARSADINGAPNYFATGTNRKYGIFWSHHHYAGTMTAEGSFHGFGPSISWEASTELVGRGDDSRITLDWGVSGAVLFGRQRERGQTDITGTHYTRYAKTKFPPVARYHTDRYDHPDSFSRSRAITVPNIGGFAGISFRYLDLKMSFGYRADVYFSAMDGGIAERDSENRSFYGPFAKVSIGLGD